MFDSVWVVWEPETYQSIHEFLSKISCYQEKEFVLIDIIKFVL